MHSGGDVISMAETKVILRAAIGGRGSLRTTGWVEVVAGCSSATR
jgi:hypothetical protein